MKTITRDDDFYPFGFSGRYGRVYAMDRPHRHHEVELFYVEEGSCSRTFGGRSYRFCQGSILLFWGAYPHQLLKPPGKCLILYIPLRFFLNWEFDRSFLQRILKGDLVVIPETDETLDVVRLLKKRVSDGKIVTPSRATELEIQGQFLHLADIAAERPKNWRKSPEQATAHADHLSHIFAYLVENFQSPVQLADLGRACRLHPNYVWNIFRRATGRTPIEYLTEYRLTYAKELLQRTTKTILDVALDSGFGSMSQFYAVFHKWNRMTPTSYRRMKRRGGPKSAS